MTAHIPPERHAPSQEAVDLVAALQRCLTSFHANDGEAAILDGDTEPQRAALARYIGARRMRSTLLGANLFADPAWDILLALFQAHLEGRDMSLEQLSETQRLSLNVVVGQVSAMERRGLLVESRTSPNSRRRREVRLSPLATDAMASWLTLAFGD